MVAPAANEAQPQGPQVPRAPQANAVQEIVAEQPPVQPILDAKGLEVMCLFSYFASVDLLLPHGRCVYCFVAAVLHLGILIYLFFRHEKFFYSFVPSWPMLFIAFLSLLYTIEFAWYNSFSFSLFFCPHLVSYLFVFCSLWLVFVLLFIFTLSGDNFICFS